MPIKMDGHVTVDAPRQEVWDLLFDLTVLKNLAGHIPGLDIELLDQTDDTHYQATVTLGVAAVKGKYDVTVTILEKRAPEFIRFKGEGKGGGNFTSGEMELTLADQEGKTLMTYLGKGNLGGPLASVGQRLVDTVGRQFIDLGTKALADEIGARHRAMMTEAAPAPVAGTEVSVTEGSPTPVTGSQAIATSKIPMQTVAVILGVMVIVALVVYFGLIH